ncbi:MAG: hypothetical protein KatS3mg026_1088 [Bacteroidia bacterium]|nr:MAG: hypothetical protein KatS3mg026_1088 [Bacteroidia bacterium]
MKRALLLACLWACSRETGASSPWESTLFGPQGWVTWLGRSAADTTLFPGIAPYYADSLGWVYLYSEEEGTKFWVEVYRGQGPSVQTLSLTWESTDFRQLTERYVQLRRLLERRYGPSRGVVGRQYWSLDTLEAYLVLSPERRYLQVHFVRR